MKLFKFLAPVAVPIIFGASPVGAAEINATIVGAGYVESQQNLKVSDAETKDTRIGQESSLVSVEAEGDSEIGGTIIAAGYVKADQDMAVSGGKHDGSAITQTATGVRVIARD